MRTDPPVYAALTVPIGALHDLVCIRESRSANRS